MNPQFQSGMAEATRLTQAGKLAEATALIQRLLNGGGQAHDTSSVKGTAPGIIDADYVIVDEPAPKAAPRAEAASARPAPDPFAGLRRPRARMGLAETLRSLKTHGMPSARGPAEPLPEGASFETLSFGNAAGSRDYKLYVPANRPDGPMPLVVMLHGCTQSPDDFAAGTGMNRLAEAQGFLVAYPSQTNAHNAQKCWNWFKPEDQARDRGEASLIAGITRRIMKDHPVDPARIYIAGLSAGGAAAANMAAAYPDLYAAVGVHSGLAAGAAGDMPSAFAAMRQGSGGRGKRHKVPTIIFHGDADHTVSHANGEEVAAQATAAVAGLTPTVQPGQKDGGHRFSRTIHADPSGKAHVEHWTIHGAGHAWAGGSPSGSYTDPRGPDASAEMLRFFLTHRRG